MNQDSFAYLQTLMGHKRKVNLLGECISLLELKLPLTGLSNRIYCLTVLKAESLRSRYWQDWFLLGAVRGLLFSHQVMSNPLRPHGRQHARLPYPPLSPGVCSNLCLLSRWCYLTIFLCHPLLLLPSIFPSIRVFSNELALRIRWPKYWTFSISPSNEYSGLMSFRIDWFDLLAVQGTLKGFSSTTIQKHQFFCTQSFLFSNPVYSLNGEGNGTPLQYSCLENPMDGGAW